MKTAYLILLIISPLWAFAQQAETISCKTNKTVRFTYNNVDELLQPKAVDNAIELNLKIKQNTYNVFAQVIAADNRYYSEFNNKLALRLRGHSSYNANTIQEVTLSQSPALLFTQPSIDKPEVYNFYYDLVLSPFTTFVAPGQYNFYITFTMTKP